MRIAVAGSIATDHLMTFEGRFAEQIIPEQIQQLSLSFLIDELDVRRGGVAANICFGMGGFGLNPVLVGAAGADFEEYRAWLDRHGVDTSAVHISELRLLRAVNAEVYQRLRPHVCALPASGHAINVNTASVPVLILSGAPMERSAAEAFARLIQWMESDYGWDRWRAYDILTHVAEISVGYYAIGTAAMKIAKTYLKQPGL